MTLSAHGGIILHNREYGSHDMHTIGVIRVELGSLVQWHLLADDDGMSGLGIDSRRDRHASAGYGIRIFLLAHHTVLDDLSSGRRYLALYRRRSRRERWRWRGRCRNRRLLARTTNQEHQQNKPQILHG
jgi:hypothetical protein